MKISRNWLSDYIHSDKTDNDLEDQFTQLGLECSVSQIKINLDNVVVGKVIDCIKHPNADRLNICKVDVGIEVLEIVCGAPNINKGLTVAVAKIGAKLGDFKIKKVEIRDIVSSGMICSGKELSINEENDGILILDDNFAKGSSIEDVLELVDNSIFDFDMTPNRGDCFSHLGISRELSIIENKKLILEKNKFPISSFKSSDLINVNIKDDSICKRYACRIIKNIKVTESPLWLKNKLDSIGQNSINNIVDIANYIMFDLGQPLHVFDFDKISNKTIDVRLSSKGEKITCLNKEVKILSDNDIVISDGNSPIAIAGVIGGLNSFVSSKTVNILVESAVFNEINIRRTSKLHNYSKEASKRFERGVDCDNVVYSMNKFVAILLENSSGEASEDYIDIYKNKISKLVVEFNLDKCNEFLGIDLSHKEVGEIFNILNISLNPKGDEYLCDIPFYRNDIKVQVDLFEEVARVYGYNNIPSNISFTFPSESFIVDHELLDNKIRSFLSFNSFNEHYSNSLYSEDDCKVDSFYKPIELINPLNKDMQYLRNSLLPGLLRAVSFNLRRGNNFIKLYELGNINSYNSKSFNNADQHKHLMLTWVGNEIKHWKNPYIQDIYSMKGEIKHLFDMLNINGFNFYLTEPNLLELNIDNKKVGSLKKISKNILKNFDIENSVYICSIDLDLVNNYFKSKDIDYMKINNFPSITRDISILIKNKYSNQNIESLILKNGGQNLIQLNLFDIYKGDNIPNDSKSMAYSLTFKSNNRTLTDGEIDTCMIKIIENLKNKFKAIQR
jgi:phenylalanyl-tRNA synthetase beta chain